jgi:methyl-accepting chemotaxis protein
MGLTTQKDYRLHLYVYSLVIVLLGILFIGCGVLWLFPTNLGEGYHNVQALLRDLQKVLVVRITILYAFTSLLIVLAMVVFHLLYSHRIAGPAFRIGLEAAKIAQGNLTGKIKFREHDNLMDLADSLNAVAAQYRARISTVKDYLALIDAQSTKVSDEIQQGRDEAALKRAAEEISDTMQGIERCLSEIRT